MRVEVTADDIRNGTRYRPALCPMALALSRATGQRVFVGLTQAYVILPTTSVPLNLPLAAQMFLAAFDTGLPCDPIEFEVSSWQDSQSVKYAPGGKR
jgi:hypothetical protein